MKKIISAVIILTVLFISCSKSNDKCTFNDSTIVAPASEVTDLQNYLNSQSISATAHPSGFFYKINVVGTGTAISNLCTNVSVKYKGKLTNGTIFDSTATGASSTFVLGKVIPGWQKGVPLISKGGKITLYIPPSLGYGGGVAGPIPANSKLIFDIELVEVTN